ncbi:MAG: hypothetical protein KJO13_01195 [Gammaproteobacteria bacterium]|nr:hypothetical protein [Gammaproteobacteria bacterium]
MLTTTGRAWTNDRLEAAATVLSRISADAYTRRSIELSLRQALEVESVEIGRPDLGFVDPRVWGIEEVAFAVYERLAAMRASDSPGVSGVERRLSSIEKALIEHLEEARAEFVAGLDSKARQIATTNKRFNLRIYNYLAHATYRRYRQQFAAAFPSLLPISVMAERGSPGAELCSIIDSGAPLVKTLARRWDLRPGVFRHLVGKPYDQVGVLWSRDVKGLALALNALHPQDLPGDDSDDWRQLNHMVVVGQRIFNRPIWKSAAGLEWLRECVSRARRGTRRAHAVWLPSWSEVTNIVRFRDALMTSLRRELANAQPDNASASGVSIDDAVDSLILKLARLGLADIALRFEDALGRNRADIQAAKAASGEAMLPLIPDEFLSSDGARLVRPLTTSVQLRHQGLELRNCLASCYASHYVREGSAGKVFIVGVFSPGSGKALSTAEIAVVPQYQKPTDKFVVKQHSAKADRRPSPLCKRALRELLRYCETEGIRKHLEESWEEIRNRRRAEQHKNDLQERMAVPRALKEVLGDQAYTDAVDRMRS